MIDAALSIESKALNLVDKLIVVKINKKEWSKRILKNKKYNQKEIENITKSQLSQNQKLKYADWVIDNSFSLKNTEKAVEELVNHF